MPTFRTIADLDVRGKRVLLRADLNVPMEGGRVGDATRIERTVPTVRALADRGARVVVLSHFGRPKGRREPSMSLRPVADALASALGRPVAFAEDCVGEAAAGVVDGLPEGGVALLENLRFHAGEEKGDADFTNALAALGDVYVNDAFSTAHRAHASTTHLAERLPAAAGLLMQAELEALAAALENPERPVAAIVGGAKISTKIDVLGHLIARVDALVIGGAMANTLLLARGVEVGVSLVERDLVDTAREIMERAAEAGCQLVLPTDAVVAVKLEKGVEARTVSVGQVPSDMMILDIGPDSVAHLETELEVWRTILWNGPLGAFEVEPFDRATNLVARKAAELTKAGKLRTVAGGGDTVSALVHAGVIDDFSYVSTAGGAFLEYLEGRTLPGVAALEQAAKG